MIRVIVTLICCLFVTSAFPYDEEAKEEIFLSTPEQIGALSSSHAFLIGGIVSPLSGSPTLRQTDFVVKGAQDIALSRIYMPPYMPVQLGSEKKNREEWEKYHLYQHMAHHYKGWQFYPHLKLQFTPSKKQILITEPSGSTLSFVFTGPGMTHAKLEGNAYAVSNCPGETPSGKNDPRNTRITYGKSGNLITVYGTDNTRRIYRFNRWNSAKAQLYLLDKEILPNGKMIKYHYTKGQPTYVESLDPGERFVYASIRIKGSPWRGNVHFLSSSGQTADYAYERRRIHVKIKEKTKHWYGDHKFEAEYNLLCPPTLIKVSSPNFRKETLSYCGRFLFGSYEGKDHHFQIVNRGYGRGLKHYRAHQLFLPVGEGDAFIPVYELSYDPPLAGEKGGKTIVKNPSDGTSIVYHFSKNLLTSKIEYFGEDGILKKEKIFFWNHRNYLQSYELRDKNQNLFCKKSFAYDSFGNPILETWTGDLTGTGQVESTWTKRLFSDDGKNLLLREETENGKVTSFSYLKGTNLLTSKLIQDGNTIIRRKFWIYDDCHNLIEEISDDGKSENPDDLVQVTERRKTSYLLRQSAPFLHMPEWVIETYFDLREEKLLKKSHLIYDDNGNVIQEEVYDAEENFAYTIEKTYNERGDLLSETNRLGQKATYTYDPKGRRTTETNFSGRLRKTYTYDTKGRLCTTLEEGDNGNRHTTDSKYDFHDRLSQRTDPFGNDTYYTYDPVVDEISQTDFPNIAALDGTPQKVKTTSTYDSFGREITHTDGNGNTTSYAYNIYGSKSKIRRPNGAIEICRYAKNGDLLSHTDGDGLTTSYEHDALGRILKKTYLSRKGETLAEETFTYSGFHLTFKTDKEGHVRSYFYDGAGRKMCEEYCGKITEFTYDSLGRLAAVYKYNDDDALVTHYERDLEDRILTEKKTDLSGNLLHKIAFSYDSDGNRETITRYINGKKAVELFAYDPFSRKTYYRDALGYETHTSYDESFTNDLGQKALQIKIADPKGIVTVKTQDALHNQVQAKKLDEHGQVVSLYENTYDPHGNLLLHKDHIYEDGRFLSTQAVRYCYTSDHEIASVVRGYGTDEERKTKYGYSNGGKMVEKTLPDEVTLFYSYHPLGFISRIDSSDREIAHSFSHNRLGDLLIAFDEKRDLKIKREVDPFGNIIRETFPHGIQITKTYDDFSRPLSLTIAGHGQVHYTYDPLFLREVERRSISGHPIYKHTYEEYDLSGNLMRESLIENLGVVNHTADARGQKTHMTSPYFSQGCQYNCVQDLISITTDGATTAYQYDSTSQMIREEGALLDATYSHDSLYNRTQKKETRCEVNPLSELISDGKATYAYDLRGNRVCKTSGSQEVFFRYDPLNQLVEVKSGEKKTQFLYDPLGRRLAKILSTKTQSGWEGVTREYYLYDGEEEIGSFTSSNKLNSFRVLSTHSLPKTISVELQGKAFASITDVQGNIRRLVDPHSKTLAARYDYTAFGEKLRATAKEEFFSPWQFASKRLDPTLGLIYFGKRYYDPTMGRWLTKDPAGFEDSFNPYQYALNNPFRYYDPHGENLVGYLLGLGEIALGGALIISGGVLEVATLGGFTIGIGATTGAGLGLIASGLAMTTYHAQDLSMPWKTEFPAYKDILPTRILEKSEEQSKEYKKPKPKVSGKEGSKNIPSWAEGERPFTDESGKGFAKRLMDKQYGPQQHDTGPKSDFSKLKKYGDRAFE